MYTEGMENNDANATANVNEWVRKIQAAIDAREGRVEAAGNSIAGVYHDAACSCVGCV